MKSYLRPSQIMYFDISFSRAEDSYNKDKNILDVFFKMVFT